MPVRCHFDVIIEIRYLHSHQLMDRYAKQEGVTEELKAQNQMEWVRRMNSIRNRAEEAIYHMLIHS